MTGGYDDVQHPFPDAAAREELAEIVDDVVRWRLTEQRWALVQDALARVGAALRDGDPEGYQRAVADVELLGPVRATRIGEDPTVPPPEQVRDLTNELVHRIKEGSEPSGGPPSHPRHER